MFPGMRRLLLFALCSLALAGSYHVTTFAEPPAFLVCETGTSGQWFVSIDGNGMGAAVHHCLGVLGGHPVGVVR